MVGTLPMRRQRITSLVASAEDRALRTQPERRLKPDKRPSVAFTAARLARPVSV